MEMLLMGWPHLQPVCVSSYPECASQFCVRKFGGQFEVLKADSLAWSLVPGEQHGQLEGRDLQVVLAHLVLERDLKR